MRPALSAHALGTQPILGEVSPNPTPSTLKGEMRQWIPVDQLENLALMAGRRELASIRLGEHEGQWVFALNHQQTGGDCWGVGSPLGISTVVPRTFPDRDAALAGAIAYARDRWAGREREMAPQIAWLDTLVPDQPDLFALTERQAA